MEPTTDPATLDSRGRRLRNARRWRRRGRIVEWFVILLVAFLYGRSPLLNLDPMALQQTFEHNEAATLHVLTEQALRAGVVPLWNPYMSSGFPVAGDFVSNFWNPLATIPVWLFGGVNGYKVAAFLALLVAGLGQWAFGKVLGLRAPFRLWSALLFMLSGGLALYWFLGWHQLLIGAAWFPACFAAVIWALRSRRLAPLSIAALTIFMVLTSAGGYFFLYLGVSLTLLTLLLIAIAPAGQRWKCLRRGCAIAALSLGLLAVVIVPGIDVHRDTTRETVGDPHQSDSQSISYALVNYLVADPDWFNLSALGKPPGTLWLYVGALPLFALIGVPFALAKGRRAREALLLSGSLLALLLVWHANRHTPVGWVYDGIPFLYKFRFTGRMLVAATSPLLAVSALSLQELWNAGRRWLRRSTVQLELSGAAGPRRARISASAPAALALMLLLAISVYDVFGVNQAFAFKQHQTRDARPRRAIEWLHEHDGDLYYIQGGDWRIWWWWTTAAYERRQPYLNFAYNRRTNTFLAQQRDGAVVRATPRYVFPWDDSPPANLVRLEDVHGYSLYYDPEALPYAFAVTASRLQETAPLRRREVRPLEARWQTPNTLLVRADSARAGDHLIALVSDFPGWTVAIDGRPARLETVNDYLGVRTEAGSHVYTFEFRPRGFSIGLTISGLAFALAAVLLVAELRRRGAGIGDQARGRH